MAPLPKTITFFIQSNFGIYGASKVLANLSNNISVSYGPGEASGCHCTAKTGLFLWQTPSVVLSLGFTNQGSKGVCFSESRLSLIHISEPTRLGMISYAVF